MGKRKLGINPGPTDQALTALDFVSNTNASVLMKLQSTLVKQQLALTKQQLGFMQEQLAFMK